MSVSVCAKSNLFQQVKKDKEDKKKKKFQLGVAESKMGNSIQEETGIPCVCNDFTGEVLRGIRMHATRFMKDLEESDMNKVSILQYLSIAVNEIAAAAVSVSFPPLCLEVYPLWLAYSHSFPHSVSQTCSAAALALQCTLASANEHHEHSQS